MTISGLFIPTNIEYTSYLELRSLFTRQETEMQKYGEGKIMIMNI